MREYPWSGSGDDPTEPYVPLDGEENSGNRITVTTGQTVYAYPRLELAPHVRESLIKEMKRVGFRTIDNTDYRVVTISDKNKAWITKWINDKKLIYALDEIHR